jgi:hypothetical protein
MNPWLVWMAFVTVALALGLVGRYFSLSTLRVTAGLITLATVAYATWYGSRHPAKAPGSLSDAFIRGADALGVAFLRPLEPTGHHLPGPGRIGWLSIAVLLVIGSRGLEAWAVRHQAPSLDTSALTPDRRYAPQNDPPANGRDALTDRQRHDRLAAELKFRLPAVEVTRRPSCLVAAGPTNWRPLRRPAKSPAAA